MGRRERLICGPGFKAMPRRAFFLAMRGVPGRMNITPSRGAAARGGDAMIAGKDPVTKLCLGVSPAGASGRRS